MQLKRGLFRSPGASPSSTESADETDQEFDVVESPPPPFELELLEAALIVATGRLLSSKRFRHHSVTVPCEVGALKDSATPLPLVHCGREAPAPK